MTGTHRCRRMGREIRNSKLEMRNKPKIRMTQPSKPVGRQMAPNKANSAGGIRPCGASGWVGAVRQTNPIGPRCDRGPGRAKQSQFGSQHGRKSNQGERLTASLRTGQTRPMGHAGSREPACAKQSQSGRGGLGIDYGLRMIDDLGWEICRARVSDNADSPRRSSSTEWRQTNPIRRSSRARGTAWMRQTKPIWHSEIPPLRPSASGRNDSSEAPESAAPNKANRASVRPGPGAPNKANSAVGAGVAVVDRSRQTKPICGGLKAA